MTLNRNRDNLLIKEIATAVSRPDLAKNVYCYFYLFFNFNDKFFILRETDVTWMRSNLEELVFLKGNIDL